MIPRIFEPKLQFILLIVYFSPAIFANEQQKHPEGVQVTRQTRPEIEIIQSPQDQRICPGGQATFQCQSTGTNDVPRWSINSVEYSVSDLPLRFEFSNQRLLLNPVRADDHGLTVSCMFLTYRDGRFTPIRSETGTLSSAFTGFGTIQRESSCHSREDLDNFRISDQLIGMLSENTGRIQETDLQVDCWHFDKIILLDASTGLSPLSTLTSGSVLALIDPQKHSGPLRGHTSTSNSLSKN